MPNPEPNYVHPRSAVAVRRAGARLSAVDPQNPPHTYGPSGVVPSPKAARGIIVYIGLDAQAYNAFTRRWHELERSGARTLEVATMSL